MQFYLLWPDNTWSDLAYYTGTPAPRTEGTWVQGAPPEGLLPHTGIQYDEPKFPQYRSALIASGAAVVHFTDDGTANGNAIWLNGPNLNSVRVQVSDATTQRCYSWVWSNGNKTLTVVVKKQGVANIITGVIGLSNSDGDLCYVSACGNPA